MGSYDALRHFADSWGLLILILVFLSALLWVLRPGARGAYRDRADIPFKYDQREE